MSSHRFWVVGGEFRSLEFEEIVSGTERLYGPFATREEAERAWRRISEAHRAHCMVRFTIAQERPRAAA
jgi:hypothetical protein